MSDPHGILALQAADPSLNGAGVKVGQVESSLGSGDLFEVNPASLGLASPPHIVYIPNSNVPSVTFNSANFSSHAQSVAANFYGSAGAATGVSAVYNYDSNAYAEIVFSSTKPTYAMDVVNQSFIYGMLTYGTMEGVDMYYDAFAYTNNVLFCSAVGNGGSEVTYTTPVTQINSPSTCFNGLAVSDFGGSSGVGPAISLSGTVTRSKPDICADAGETSFSTPIVAGCAAVMIQYLKQLLTTVPIILTKAVLLAGTTKPAGWTNTPTAPLDTRWGAGVVNAYNSYLLVKNRQFVLDTVSTSVQNKSYKISLTSTSNISIALVWNRTVTGGNINNLHLSLLSSTGSQIAISNSTVDNVQYINAMNVPAGDYTLSVGFVSVATSSESFAIAYSISPVPSVISVPSLSAAISLPSTANGSLFVWSTNSNNVLTFSCGSSYPTSGAVNLYNINVINGVLQSSTLIKG